MKTLHKTITSIVAAGITLIATAPAHKVAAAVAIDPTRPTPLPTQLPIHDLEQLRIEAFQRRFLPNFTPEARFSRPTLVVLIHGGTSDPNQDPNPFLEPQNPANGPSNRPGNLGYSRFYWDFPFVAKLVGALTPNLFTMDGFSLTTGTWKTSRTENNNLNARFAFPDRDPRPTRGIFGGTAAALVRANGSVALGTMAKQVLDEIRTLRTVFESYSGREPYIVLVGHSKGGLVIRYLLSIPEGSVAGHNLSTGDEDFLRELRNDTKFAITVASPHTGSPLADGGTELREKINDAQDLLDLLATPLAGLGLGNPVDLTFARDILTGATDEDLGHLTREFWKVMNNGHLHPSKMVRSDGTRIPIYLYGGRAPADNFFSSSNFNSFTNDLNGLPSLLSNSNERTRLTACASVGLMGLDWLIHNPENGNWGSILNAGAVGKNLDLVRRSHWIMPAGIAILTPPGAKIFPLDLESMPIIYLRNQPDRETDSDGMVGIDSALGIGLLVGPGAILAMKVSNFPIPAAMMEPFDHTQASGSWYRMYSGGWDFTNHFTETKRPELGTEINRVLLTAGPLPSTAALSVWPAR